MTERGTIERGEGGRSLPDVVILCGGLGTRLQGVVSDRPKPMADIEGRPFLDLLVTYVSGFGLRRFVLCAGYKADAVVQYFRQKNSSCKIECACESVPMGTGGALWNARALIRSDPFLVLNGDSFCAVDFLALIDSHARRQACATLVVTPAARTDDYGQVLLAAGDRVVAFREKTVPPAASGHSPPPATVGRESAASAAAAGNPNGLASINAGIYLVSQQLMPRLGVTVPLSLEREVFPGLATEQKLYAFPVAGPLLDIGTPERYQYARQQLVRLMFSG